MNNMANAPQSASSLLGNLASVEVNVNVTPVSALYVFLVIALGAVCFFLAKKYI